MARSSGTTQKPTQRTRPATIIRLVRVVEQPVVGRPVRAVPFYGTVDCAVLGTTVCLMAHLPLKTVGSG